MQGRRASRELALILFSQLDKNIENYTTKDFEDTILKSVRILTSNAGNDLKLTLGALFKMKEFIEEYEADHELNAERPIGTKNISVPVPMTSDMIRRIEQMLDVAEKSLIAIEVAEFVTLESQDEVREYAIKIAQALKENSEAVDECIKNCSKGWSVERLVKIDRDILRIAIIELLYVKEAPMKVIIDEALELGKKYSTEDSAAFINGILARIVAENSIS